MSNMENKILKMELYKVMRYLPYLFMKMNQ